MKAVWSGHIIAAEFACGLWMLRFGRACMYIISSVGTMIAKGSVTCVSQPGELMEATHKALLMRPCVAMYSKMMIYDITTGYINNIDV